MGMGLNCCKQQGVACVGFQFDIPAFNGSVVPGLHFIDVRLEGTFAPAPPWPALPGGLGGAFGSNQSRLLEFTGIVGGLLRFERPAVAIAQGGDGVGVTIDFDPAVDSFPSVVNPCLECHLPVTMTISHPVIPSGSTTYTFAKDSGATFFNPCGLGHWENATFDFCPDKMVTRTTPKIFRTNTVATKQFRVTVTGITVPQGFCTDFNRSYDLDIFDPINDPTDNLDGWHTSGGFWESDGIDFGPGNNLAADVRLQLPDAILGLGPGGFGPPVCSPDPWGPPGNTPTLSTALFEDFSASSSTCSVLHRFTLGAVSKTTLFDLDWSDMRFESTGLCDLAFECGNVNAALQALVFTEL